MQGQEQNQEEPLPQVDIAELIRRVKTRKYFFGAFVVAGMLISTLYSVFAKPIWEAKAVLYFPVRPVSMIANLGQGGSGGLSSLLSGGSSSSLDIFRGFLDSNSALRIVAKDSGIKKKDVRKMRRLETNPVNSQMTISATSLDKNLAFTVVKSNLDALTKINSRTQGKFSTADVVVLNDQVNKLKFQIHTLEGKLLASYQGSPGFMPTATSSNPTSSSTALSGTWASSSKSIEIELAGVNARIAAMQNNLNRAYALGSTSSIGIPSVSPLEANLVKAEANLKVESQFLGPKAVQILQLRAEVSGLQQQIKQQVEKFYASANKGVIEAGGNSALQNYVALIIDRAGLDAQYTIASKLAKEAPLSAMQISKLSAQLKLKYGLLLRAEGELLTVRAQQMHDPVTWNVLDSPYVKKTPVNKHWLRNLADGLAVGLLFGFLGSIRKPIR